MEFGEKSKQHARFCVFCVCEYLFECILTYTPTVYWEDTQQQTLNVTHTLSTRTHAHARIYVQNIYGVVDRHCESQFTPYTHFLQCQRYKSQWFALNCDGTNVVLHRETIDFKHRNRNNNKEKNTKFKAPIEVVAAAAKKPKHNIAQWK